MDAKVTKVLNSGVLFLYREVIEPRSSGEDSRRHEFILNVLLAGSIVMMGLLDLSLLYRSTAGSGAYDGISFLGFFILTIGLAYLLFLSRRGYFANVAYVLIAFYYLTTTYSVYRWGVNLPANLLGYVFVIIMSGILVSSRFSFYMGFLTFITLAFFGVRESNAQMVFSWQSEPINALNALQYGIMLFLVIVVSWLSNREIEKSLSRARRSEEELKLERDSLEVKVKEKTEELMKERIEKMTQMYRFAEFGKLSSGIFHDLMNPLTSLILHIREMKADSGGDRLFKPIDQAISSAKKVEDLIAAVRKQMQAQEIIETYCLNDEIRQMVGLLNYKAKKAGVELTLDMPERVETKGNPLKFNQIVLNLISNAIDSYDGLTKTSKVVKVRLIKGRERISLWVEDEGCGISRNSIPKIFDPLFTTKNKDKGVGLGLSTTKSIVEGDFYGDISVESEEGAGSVFKVSFPYEQEKSRK